MNLDHFLQSSNNQYTTSHQYIDYDQSIHKKYQKHVVSLCLSATMDNIDVNMKRQKYKPNVMMTMDVLIEVMDDFDDLNS